MERKRSDEIITCVTQGDEESIGWKTKKVRVRVNGKKEKVGKISDEFHHIMSHKATFGGRAIHSQSEKEKMIK